MRNTPLTRRKTKNAGTIMVLAFLCFIAVACGKNPVKTPLPGPTEIPTKSPTQVPTNTPTQMPINTLIPLATNSPTEMPTASPTHTPTAMPNASVAELADTFADGKYAFPVISISTPDSSPIYKAGSTIPCVIDTLNCPEEFAVRYTAQIRVRGNASSAPDVGKYTSDSFRAQYPNDSYPYKIKFDEKQNLFGFNSGNKFKDWVLLEATPYRPLDNLYAFSLAKALHGGKYYVTDACMVHVYLNGSYMGIYTLCEQSEAKKHRVGVTKPSEGYTGTDIGYFLEIDNYATNKSNTNPWFAFYHENATVTDIQGVTRKIKEKYFTIHSDITCDAQTAFIEKYMVNAFKILYEAVENKKYYTFDADWNLIDGAGIYDNAKDCIGAVMDLESIVYAYLVEEITMDVDRGSGSFYMAVDFSEKSKYKKLTFLCPWDFEFGYMSASAFPDKEYQLIAGAFDNMYVDATHDRVNAWFLLLIKEDWFRDMVCGVWSAFYGEVYDNMVAELITYAQNAADDRTLANSLLKAKKKSYSYSSFTGLIDEKSVTRKRVDWLNDHWFGAGITR